METIKESFENAIRRHDRGAIIIAELKQDSYERSNASLVGSLTARGFEGVYISLRMPFKDAVGIFKEEGADIKKIFPVGIGAGAAKTGKDQPEKGRPGMLKDDFNAQDIVRFIQNTTPKMKSAKKFIYLDSVGALSSARPLPDLMMLFEFLTRTVKKREIDYCVLVYEESMPKKKFFKDTAIHADEIIQEAKG